jgi:hypothetical protein
MAHMMTRKHLLGQQGHIMRYERTYSIVIKKSNKCIQQMAKLTLYVQQDHIQGWSDNAICKEDIFGALQLQEVRKRIVLNNEQSHLISIVNLHDL